MLEDWTIFVKEQNGTPDSAIFLRGGAVRYEIYGAAFADGEFHEHSFCELLSAALNACKRMGARYMTYLCGEEERKALQELGFRYIGEYVLYAKSL